MKPGSGTPQENSAATEICGTCMNDLTDDSNSVKCDSCHNRTHKKCAGLTQAELNNLKRPNCKLMWLCGDCKPKLKRLETIEDELSKLTNKVDMIVNLLSIQENLSIEERIRNVISAELRAFETNIEEKVLSRMSQNIHPAITAKNDTQRGSTEAQEEEPKHVAIVKEKETSTEVTKTDVQEGNQHGEPIIRGDSEQNVQEASREPDTAIEPDGDHGENAWSNVVQRQARKRTRITGNKPDNSLRAAERIGWLYVGKLHSATTSEELRNYLTRNGVQEVRECIQLETKGTNKAFRVGIPFADLNRVNLPDFWPKDVLVRQYLFRGRKRNTGVLLDSHQPASSSF